MKVRELTALCDIWRMAERDRSTLVLGLSAGRAHLMALHCEAVRRVRKGETLGLDPPVQVNGSTLSGILPILDSDADVKLRQTESTLVLNAADRRAVLPLVGGTLPERPQIVASHAKFNSSRLTDSLKFLGECIAQEGLRPILTGVCFRRDRGGLALLATDADRLVGMARMKGLGKLLTRASGQVVPTEDLQTALSILGDRISLRFSKSHIVLSDRDTDIRLSLLNGKFPSLAHLPRPQEYKRSLTFDVNRVGVAIKAALLLDEDRLLSLVVKDRYAAWLVQGQEVGGFRVSVGDARWKDTTITFDAHSLRAARLLGDRITLDYKDASSPTLFRGKDTGRFLWAAPLVQRKV